MDAVGIAGIDLLAGMNFISLFNQRERWKIAESRVAQSNAMASPKSGLGNPVSTFDAKTRPTPSMFGEQQKEELIDQLIICGM
jgi:hypothetical protein